MIKKMEILYPILIAHSIFVAHEFILLILTMYGMLRIDKMKLRYSNIRNMMKENRNFIIDRHTDFHALPTTKQSAMI